MSNDEVTLGMPVPLDSDGFLRRECPTCEREFKWLPGSTEDPGAGKPSDGGHFCLYCGIQAPDGSWFTKAQVELAQNMVATEVVEPLLKDFVRETNSISRCSGGMIEMSAHYDPPDKMDPLTEADDMQRVDFECHPSVLIKVLDEWDRSVYCLICGEAAS
ncbi:MAG: hypothetical protein JO281_01710 [Pseudonocardiales bacterium]|nr:hypothetical protein [Pseudonocardiales bacterium]